MRYIIPLMALVLLAMPARAQETSCSTDADCPDGTSCVLSPCARPACFPDGECPEVPDCVPVGVCQEAPWNGACSTDADCPAGFTCDVVEVPCAVDACPPCTCACPAEGECPPCECPPCDVPEPGCTPTTASYCQYHARECAGDADCHAGWECKVQEACIDSGCACPPCIPDGECLPCDCPETSQPTCTSAGSWCQPKATPCSTDADCPAEFECIDRTIAAPCACADCACRSDVPDCWCPPCECPDPATEKVCLPRGWAAAGYDTASPEPGESLPQDYATDAVGGADATTPPAGTGAESQAKATNVGEGGNGCVAAVVPGPASGLLLLGFLAGIPVLRRRLGGK